MGAFAGSAALLCQNLRSDVSVVTLTMNNSCNLKCPHCYLQYAEKDAYVSPWVIDVIAQSAVEAVAIVGMEPLKNPRSAHELGLIVEAAKSHGKLVGVVTNALNAHLMSKQTAGLLDWLDVSVDGDRRSYSQVRGAPVEKLERGIRRFRDLGVKQISVLHTLHADNLARIALLADFGRDLATGQVVLSPFAATRHEGTQPRDLTITPSAFLAALKRSDCDLSNCWVVLDLDWVTDAGQRQDFEAQVNERLGGRTVMFKADPTAYGMVRITYDARLMTPRQAMHTQDYGKARPRTRAELVQALATPSAGLI